MQGRTRHRVKVIVETASLEYISKARVETWYDTIEETLD